MNNVQEKMSKMGKDELYGFFYFGSKLGKRLAEEELIRRGELSKNKVIRYFQKLFK